MSGIDTFASTLLEQAKRFLEKAEEADGPEDDQAYLHAALVLGVCALEAHVNALTEELALRPRLSILDQSILTEKDYSLDKGTFEMKNKLKMYRLEDRILFIFKRFTTREDVTASSWWTGVKAAIDLRNNIVHPRETPQLTDAHVRRALKAELDCLNALYRSLFHRRYPGYGRGLSSRLTF